MYGNINAGLINEITCLIFFHVDIVFKLNPVHGQSSKKLKQKIIKLPAKLNFD